MKKKIMLVFLLLMGAVAVKSFLGGKTTYISSRS